MSDDPKKRLRAWIWWGTPALLLLYVASYFPAVFVSHWLISLGAISQASGNATINVAYAPIVAAARRSSSVDHFVQIGLNALAPLHPTRFGRR